MSFPVMIGSKAAEQLKNLLARKGDAGTVVRLGVKGGGCSGFEYVMKIDAPRDRDLTLVVDGLTVVCDPKSAKYLEGSELEYTGNLMSGGFSFINPNAERACGCGTSFTPRAPSPD